MISYVDIQSFISSLATMPGALNHFESRAKHCIVCVKKKKCVRPITEEVKQQIETHYKSGLDFEHDDRENMTASRYRPIAARANFMAQDRSDSRFAVAEISRGMQDPIKIHWRK